MDASVAVKWYAPEGHTQAALAILHATQRGHLALIGRKLRVSYHPMMITVRISEAELANDVRAVLDKIRLGSEVIIENEDHSPMAVMRKAEPVGRKISECIRILKAHEAAMGHALVPDPDFAADVAAAVAAHREPLEVPEWD